MYLKVQLVHKSTQNVYNECQEAKKKKEKKEKRKQKTTPSLNKNLANL